jgi:hypothetical protein
MPNWKKIIVSGSNAALNSLNVTNGITGSLLGTSSFATTASFAQTASFLLGSVANAVSSSYALTASYIEGQFFDTFSQLSPATTWSFNHNLNELHPVITVWDDSNEVIIPERIVASNANTTLIYFPTAVAGYASATVGSILPPGSGGDSFPFTGSALITGSLGITGSLDVTGGITGSLLGTASFSTSASFATTSSYSLNVDGGFY